MLRRDLLNILFKSNSSKDPMIYEADPVLSTPAYLITDGTIPIYKQWTSIQIQEPFLLEVSTDYAFTLTIEIGSTSLIQTELLLGVKNNPSQEGHQAISCGLNEKGSLFIGHTVDQRVLPVEMLTSGFQLVLSINPQKDGFTHAKLKIMNTSGLTLSIVKSNQFRTSDWMGNIKISSIDFNFLRLEGRKSTEI